MKKNNILSENNINLDVERVELASQKGNKFKVISVKGISREDAKLVKQYKGKWTGSPNNFWWWYENEEEFFNKFKDYIETHPSDDDSTTPKYKVTIIDAIDGAIKTIQTASGKNSGLTKVDKEKIEQNLEAFKNKILNIKDDEDFKKIINQLSTIRGNKGRGYTMHNKILISIQDSAATNVNSASVWLEIFNRTIIEGSPAIYIKVPTGSKESLSKEDKDKVLNDFLSKLKKQYNANSSYDEKYNLLTPNEKIKFKDEISRFTDSVNFTFGPVYDVRYTKQIEGKEDFVKQSDDIQKDIKWYDDENVDETVRPIYETLLTYCQSKGINVDFSDDLGGARGVSKNGSITLLKNEGNSIGSTKTFAHEITHELLHQTYLKNKEEAENKQNNKTSEIFYIGKGMGTATIEQQAELSAWMFMHAFGFDVKTTSLNYTVMWGGNENNMLSVLNTISSVVNHLITYVNENNGEINEDISKANKITSDDIAALIGGKIEKKYESLKKQNLSERLKYKLNKRIF